MRALAVGDSITRTGGAIVAPNIEPLSWAQRVAQVAGWELDTHAVSGYPLAQILAECVPTEGRWDVALTCVGTNDVLRPHAWDEAAFARDLERLLARLEGLAERTIVLGVMPDVGRLPTVLPYGTRRRARALAVNSLLAQAAVEHDDVTFVPAPCLGRPVDLFGDGVHPTSVGHARLADAVLSALGLPAVDLPAFQPTRDYLRWSRRRTLTDSIKRPPRGVTGSVLAAVRPPGQRP